MGYSSLLNQVSSDIEADEVEADAVDADGNEYIIAGDEVEADDVEGDVVEIAGEYYEVSGPTRRGKTPVRRIRKPKAVHRPRPAPRQPPRLAPRGGVAPARRAVRTPGYPVVGPQGGIAVVETGLTTVISYANTFTLAAAGAATSFTSTGVIPVLCETGEIALNQTFLDAFPTFSLQIGGVIVFTRAGVQASAAFGPQAQNRKVPSIRLEAGQPYILTGTAGPFLAAGTYTVTWTLTGKAFQEI